MCLNEACGTSHTAERGGIKRLMRVKKDGSEMDSGACGGVFELEKVDGDVR